MEFDKLNIDTDNPKNKFINVKLFFEEMGKIKEEYVKEAFDFSYNMTFGNLGKHRNYRSGGRHRRKNGEIFANTFQGKLSEFALYQHLNDKFDINKPDLSLYDLEEWDSYDFKIDKYKLSVKSTKFFGQLLLLETKDWSRNAFYIPNKEKYDFIIMIRLKDDNEKLMRENRLYYSQKCDKEELWNLFKDNEWSFDIPGYITRKELKYLIDNNFKIFKGDMLNGTTRMDATNYYCHLANTHDIKELGTHITFKSSNNKST